METHTICPTTVSMKPVAVPSPVLGRENQDVMRIRPNRGDIGVYSVRLVAFGRRIQEVETRLQDDLVDNAPEKNVVMEQPWLDTANRGSYAKFLVLRQHRGSCAVLDEGNNWSK